MLKIHTDGKLAMEEIEKLERRLSNMCSKYGFRYSQVNGQRICTSIHFPEKPKVKGTEIFIGKIPRKIFEDELIPLFLLAGPLHQFRLMLDFSLKNRGFAFATYTTSEGAEKAITLFDNFEITRNTKIGVFKSVDNCRLFFGNIPQVYGKTDIAQILKDNLIDGVSDIIMYRDLMKPELNRGYVFVEFATHRDAAMAKKQLYPGCLIVEGQSVFVDWADPIPDVASKIMAKVTKLFIHHLPVNLTKDELGQIIYRYVDPKTIIKVHKQLNYAFVHFFTREAAEKAKRALSALPFPDVAVEWARPREFSKRNRLESPPTHFCLSLPPKMRRHYQQYINTMISSDTSSNDSQKSSPNTSTISSFNKSEVGTPKREIVKRRQLENNSDMASKAMVPMNQSSQNMSYCEDEIVKKIETINAQSNSSSMSRASNGFSRVSTWHRSVRSPTPTFREEQSYRNPLIGLPVALLPTRQMNTPPPAYGSILERPKYYDVGFPQGSCRNPYFPSYFNNNALLNTGDNTPRLQHHLMPSASNQLFEFF